MIIKEIRTDEIQDPALVNIREAVRIIALDENNSVPLLFVAKNKYHKLPGGGIDEGENKMGALARECQEELGSEIQVIGEIGEIIEFRALYNLKQISYCYFGRIITKGSPQFTEHELENGFQIVWMSLDDAINTIQNDVPQDYEGGFIQERDLLFLKEFKEKFGYIK